MASLIRLSESEANSRSAGLPGWELDANTLRREFKFQNFVEAFSFMTAVAITAEKMNHHPDWSNVYDTVKIRLATHEVDGLSENDFTLAVEISKAYAPFAG
jgi:4a-hydroxytetrahydrobiopterin dehydratase